MRSFSLFLALIMLAVPTFARPFQYNIAYGPQYLFLSSSQGAASAELLTVGIACEGTLYGRLKAEFIGGTGEISTTRMNYNETALLYRLIDSDSEVLSLGPTYMNYLNVISKSGSTQINDQEFNAKLRWAKLFGRIWGLYLNATGPTTASIDIGWLAYWDEYFGDFNVSLGYKEIRFKDNSTMRGPYISSGIYF